MRCVPKMRLNSLGLKVLLAYVAGVALSIVLLVAAAVAVLRGDLLARTDLAGLAEDMAGKVRFDAGGRPAGFEASEDDLAWIYDSLRRETAWRILDQSGSVVLLSDAGAPFWPAGVPRLARGRFEFSHEGLALYGATEPFEHGDRRWYLQVAVSSRLMTLLHRVALPLVGAGVTLFGLVLLAAFGLCAYVTLRYTLKPLRDVSDGAAAISPRSLHARLKADAVPAEIAPLVDSFNHALERLEQGFRLQQAFLGNAAHELKTPLALIRAQVELGEESGAGRDALLGDVEYMTRQVQQLLLLAEASEPRNYHPAAVRVEAVAEDASTYLQRMAEAAGVRLAVSAAAADVVWQADRGALFTLLKNLLENAIQHAPAGSTVSVEVAADAVTVRDRGLGVAAAQLPLLFERFWRAEHRRDHGAGLGLSICREIALAHGWGLTAERAEPGLRLRLAKGARDGAPP